MAADWLEHGEAAYEDGRFSEARDALERGMAGIGSQTPAHARYLRLLADSYREMAQSERALETCDHGLALAGPHDLERIRLLRLRGAILTGDGKASEAEAALMEALAGVPASESVERALILRVLGEVRGAQARLAESDALYAQALENLQRLLPPNDPEVGEALNNRGVGAMRLGRLQEAETHLRAALAVRQSGLPPGHPDIGLAYHSLSTLVLRRGRLDEAKALADEALRNWEQALGPRHPRLAMVLNNLGGIARRRSSHAEAEAYFRRGLEIREETLGPEHPRLIISINNVASAAHHLGRLEEAETMFLRSLALAEKVHGPVHPEVARALNNLQAVLSDLGRDDEAEGMLLRAIGIWEQTVGPESEDLATSLSNLAVRQKKRGDVEAAEVTLLRALAIEEKRLGKDHPQLSGSLNLLGNLYMEAGNIDVAETLYRRALDLTARAGYNANVGTLLNLAHVERQRDNGAAEVAYLNQAVTVLQRSKGPESSELPRVLRDLAHALRAQGLREQALAALRQAMEIHEKTPARHAEEVVRTLTVLGATLQLDRQGAEAEKAYRRGIAMLEDDPAPSSGPLAELLILLGSHLVRTGRPKEALETLGRAQILVANTLGNDHPLFGGALLWRGVASMNIGENETAEELLLAVLDRDDETGGESRDIVALHGLRGLYAGQERVDDLARIVEDLVRRRERSGRDDARFAGLLQELATLRMTTGQHASASELYERVLAATPEADPAFRASCTFNLALCRWYLGDIDDAASRFDQAADDLRATDDRSELLNCLATQVDFLARTRRAGTSLNLITEVIGLAEGGAVPPETSARAHHALGLLYASRREWDEAVASFQASLRHWQRLDPGAGRSGALGARYHLARVNHARGEFGPAESLYVELIRELEAAGAPAAKSLATVLKDYAALLESTERPAASAEMRSRAEGLSEPRQSA